MTPDRPIPFEAFMRRALYDPQRGYYSRRIGGIGTRADFTTAPMLSAAPAKAIAAWTAKALRETGCRHLIEIGPGEGRLAKTVRGRLPWRLKWGTKLHLVETSGPLREIQRKLLGGGAHWHESPAEALDACGGRAVIFSNELVDAFPVRRFQKTNDGWLEMGVCFPGEDRVVETLLSPALLPDSSSFEIDHPLGQCIEVHDSYRLWMDDWLPSWKAGRMLTIDYGTTAEQLYHRRPRGTLRGYLLHQRIEGDGIYQNIGRQDLTADVNFTDLARWGVTWASGQRLIGFDDFLRNFHGPETALGEAASAFMVFEQCRDWDKLGMENN
jgi:SAM-dependent MidA family methyltransferase